MKNKRLLNIVEFDHIIALGRRYYKISRNFIPPTSEIEISAEHSTAKQPQIVAYFAIKLQVKSFPKIDLTNHHTLIYYSKVWWTVMINIFGCINLYKCIFSLMNVPSTSKRFDDQILLGLQFVNTYFPRRAETEYLKYLSVYFYKVGSDYTRINSRSVNLVQHP